jgi:hypothetical protein
MFCVYKRCLTNIRHTMTDSNNNLESADTERPSKTQTLDWSILAWVLVFTILLIVALNFFGITAKNKGDQSFLDVVNALQAYVGTCIVFVVFNAIFKWKSALGFLVKLIAIAMLCCILFLLTMCSSFLHTGWLGA